MRRTSASLAVAALLVGAGASHAASGTLTDPGGDFPDIVELRYDNAAAKVVMAMRYDGGRPQNESFYVRWGGDGRSYQVFNSPSAGLRELRYHAGGDAAVKRVACTRLRVTQPSAASTKVVIPRSCLGKAPDRVRFQDIATEGLYSADETKVSRPVARG